MKSSNVSQMREQLISNELWRDSQKSSQSRFCVTTYKLAAVYSERREEDGVVPAQEAYCRRLPRPSYSLRPCFVQTGVGKSRRTPKIRHSTYCQRIPLVTASKLCWHKYLWLRAHSDDESLHMRPTAISAPFSHTQLTAGIGSYPVKRKVAASHT